MPVATSIADLSQTAGSNSPAGSENPTTTDDYLRSLASFLALHRDGKGVSAEVDVASSGTCDIGGANSPFVRITGTTTITSFGTNFNGPRFVRFAGALTLTQNASTLILPGGVSITTVAGDTCVVTPLAAGWVVSQYERGGLGKVYSGTVAASTSGTSVDFTSIPAWVKRITLSLAGVSTTGTSPLMVQIGDSGGVETSGYAGSHDVILNASATQAGLFSSGFTLGPNSAASQIYHGAVVLSLLDAATNTWAVSINVGLSSVAATIHGAGSKSLSATLDRIRLTTSGGTDTFDAGSVNIVYE